MKTPLLVIAMMMALTTYAESHAPYFVQHAPAVYPQAVVTAPVYGVPAVAYRPVIAPGVPVVGRRVVAMPVVPAPVAPMPVAYVAPAPPVAVAPAVSTVVTTRYRPFLGGTVSRVRYAPSAVVVPIY